MGVHSKRILWGGLAPASALRAAHSGHLAAQALCGISSLSGPTSEDSACLGGLRGVKKRQKSTENLTENPAWKGAGLRCF